MYTVFCNLKSMILPYNFNSEEQANTVTDSANNDHVILFSIFEIAEELQLPSQMLLMIICKLM